jgi:hypothetical protein
MNDACKLELGSAGGRPSHLAAAFSEFAECFATCSDAQRAQVAQILSRARGLDGTYIIGPLSWAIDSAIKFAARRHELPVGAET